MELSLGTWECPRMGVDCCTMCGSGLYCGLELNPSSNTDAQRDISGTVHCGGVPYVVVRGDGGGLSIVKPTTPSFALCKYVYIYVFVSHYALQVQQLTPNKNTGSSICPYYTGGVHCLG